MLLVFFDETSDSKFKDYFGLSCVVINSAHYTQVKTEFHNILLKNGWNPEIEFKGSYLFSANSGDTDIDIERRILIAEGILDLNTSKKNARINFHYFKTRSTNHKDDYLEYAPQLLEKVLPKPKHKNGKDIVSIHCDKRSDISINELRSVFLPVIHKKKYTLYEDIHMVNSRFETVGILYADIVGYLIARVDTISTDAELFENIPPEEWENNGKIKKWKSSTKLLGKIKNLNLYELR